MMASMPHSTRSSGSPHPITRGHYEYPPVPREVLSSSRQSANPAVRIYHGRMEESTIEYGTAMLPLPSITSANNWSTTALLPERCSQPSPNILSAEYDPFATYQQGMNGSYEPGQNQRQQLYPSRSTETSLPPTSPSLSGVGSHRSSFSSAPASETYQHSEAYQNFPQIKMEDQLEWSSESNSSLLLANSHVDASGLTVSASAYSGCLDENYYHQPANLGWAKSQVNMGSPDYSDSMSQSELRAPARQPSAEARRLSNTIARTRTPRKMTTREDANFQCKAKGCGKLFSRSYNFKAHMETHDTGRVYPFPCPLSDCNKKFVRKTDLQRHHQSVHMKERNYQCDFCSRHFARKDTLRRHMEDGCSKRFDLAIAFNPQESSTGRVNDRTRTPAESRTQSFHPQYSPHSMPYLQTTPRQLNAQTDFLSKDDYLGSDDGRNPAWSN